MGVLLSKAWMLFAPIVTQMDNALGRLSPFQDSLSQQYTTTNTAQCLYKNARRHATILVDIMYGQLVKRYLFLQSEQNFVGYFIFFTFWNLYIHSLSILSVFRLKTLQVQNQSRSHANCGESLDM